MRVPTSPSHSHHTTLRARNTRSTTTPSSPQKQKPKARSHPIKSFYLPQTFIRQVLSIPSQILFAVLGMMGLAHYARQIVRVRPKVPGTLLLKPKTLEEENASDAASSTVESDATEVASAREVNVDQWITKNTPSLSGTFTPSWWLPNGHLQTFFIVSGDFSKTDKVDYVRTLLRVPDGGTLALDMTPPNHESLPPTAPTVLVCHGLTGNANESYVRNVLAWVARPKSEGGLGGRGVVVNFRGCGGTPVTSTQMYSAAASCDTTTAAHFLRATFPQSAIHGVGFSLGASVLARYLGESGSDSLLSSGCVLGCPWNIVDMSHALEDGWFSSRVYSSALGQNLLRMFFRAYDSNPGVFDADDSRCKDVIEDLRRLRKMGNKVRLRMVDDLLVCRVGGPIKPWPFANAQAYYEYASSDKLIHNVKVPLLGINAFDDPVIHGDALPINEVAAGTHVHLAVTGGGGHLGWFDGPLIGAEKTEENEAEEKCRTSRWIRKPIAEFLTAAARDLAPRAAVSTVPGDDGWTWVDGEPVVPQTGADPVKIGWKVLESGTPLAAIGVGAPAIQGL